MFGDKEYIYINLIASVIASFYTYISSHIYDNPLAIHALLLAYILDFLSALYKCKVNGVKIKSGMLPRFIYHLVFISGLLTFSWYLSKTNLMFYFLPSLIYGGCMSQQLLSILENLGEAGVINTNFLKYYKELIVLRYLKVTNDAKEASDAKDLINSNMASNPTVDTQSVKDSNSVNNVNDDKAN